VDFRLYSRVLWRFKRIVAVGFAVAVVLAGLSVVRVGTDGITFRDVKLWSSTTRIGVTQKGFPWGRLLAQEPTPGEAAQNLGIPQADPNRLNTLAVLYAELATSDPVRSIMRSAGALPLCDREAYVGTFLEAEAARRCGNIIATPVVVGDNRVALPLVDLVAIAPSPTAAVRLAQRSADAFATYIRRQQRANKVPVNDRVVVQQLVHPKPPTVYRPRPKTLPIVVFLAVMFATVGLVFLLENLEVRRRDVDAEPDEISEESEERPARRSAWA
jgi:hypothetical protein